jgi:cytochrome c-type biogenesis protein CcmE
MKSLKKQRRIQIIAVASIALILATALIGYAMRDGINYFRSPSEVIAEPPRESETFRIGGLVETGSLVRGIGATISFSVTDGGATSTAPSKPLKSWPNTMKPTCQKKWSMR